MWEQLGENIRQAVTRNIFHTRIAAAQAKHALGEHTPQQQMQTSGPTEPGTENGAAPAAAATSGSADTPVEVDANASRADRRRAERQQKKAKKRQQTRR